MYLIEEHIITKQHSLFKECDRLCFASKNLYNFSLYKIQEYRELNNTFPSGYDLYHIVKSDDCFKSLPNDSAKQTVFQTVDMWKLFFKTLKSWKNNKANFTGCPNPPKYKHKTSGRNVLTIPIRNCRLKNNKILFNKHIKLELNTKVDNLVEVKVVPQSNCYKIQVCYKKEEISPIISPNQIAIDLGINNLATISNNFNSKPFILNGKPLKSINQYYNKKKAKLQSKLPKYVDKNNEIRQRTYCNKIKILTQKRNNKIKWSLHNYSKKIITYCINNNISEIAIGYNSFWKEKVNMGAKNNQNFTQIPFKIFIDQILYKAKLQGISVLLNEESYTSKCSALDLEPIQKHDIYLGKRVKRGLFKTSKNFLINADLNGSFNIGRKVFGDDFIKSNRGCVVHPFKVNLNKN